LTNEGFSSFGKGGSEMFMPELGSELLDSIDESVDLAKIDFDRIYQKFGPQSIEELIIIGSIYCESTFFRDRFIVKRRFSEIDLLII
jgi:hypothetical protein